jgi:hypothetical protein
VATFGRTHDLLESLIDGEVGEFSWDVDAKPGR